MQLDQPSPSTPREQETQSPKSRNVASLVTLATCSVLAAAPGANHAASDGGEDGKREWTTQGAVLHYSEEGRINVNQGMLKFTGENDRGSLQIKMGYDIVSGPSENGAMPAPEPQTWTTPSGNAQYEVEAGELPWYEIERHPRKDISISKTDILNSTYSISYGARYSTEATYVSKSVNGGVTRYTNNKNTQYSLAVSYEDAEVKPYGGAVVPRSRVLEREDFASDDAFGEAWEGLRTEKEKDKEVFGLVMGVTQVIDRNTLMQFNYSYGESNGYQNDAQKVVSVVDEAGLPLYNVHEARPDERTKQNVFWKGKFSTGRESVLDVHYRYYWDSWDVDSHTLSAGYQMRFGDFKIEPQVRGYWQSAAGFFRHSVFADSNGQAILPMHLSADYRLAETVNYTVGLNLDYYQANGNVISARLAWYDINPETDSSYTRGYLDTVKVVPDIQAAILALSYEF